MAEQSITSCSLILDVQLFHPAGQIRPKEKTKMADAEEMIVPDDFNCKISLTNTTSVGFWKYKVMTWRSFSRTRYFKRYGSRMFPDGRAFVGQKFEFGDEDMPYICVVQPPSMDVVVINND